MKDLRFKSPEEMGKYAKEFVLNAKPSLKGATVVGLSGELGAGKTTFVQGAARALGITDTVISPTFIIERVYPIAHSDFERLIHIDAYRLKDKSELSAIGWNEIIKNPKNLIFIEWPERLYDALPPSATNISFSHVSEHERSIALQAS